MGKSLLQDVAKNVLVYSMEINPEKLPTWKDMLLALSSGTGIKGGIARKIAKVLFGLKPSQHSHLAAELNGEGDIDILIAVQKCNPEIRKELRCVFTGTKFNELILSPKDIEVSDSLKNYFLTRDITMNEVLIFRSHDKFLLFYTQDAINDIRTGVIRPSIHCLHTGFLQVWQYDKYKNKVISPKLLTRCIIRRLKKHGLCYGINEATWTFYRNRGLDSRDIFRLFKDFTNDDEKFNNCFWHLVELGLLKPETNPNMLWGDAIREVNTGLANHDSRISFGNPSVEVIERWIEQKMVEFDKWKMWRKSRINSGLQVEEDASAEVTFINQSHDEFPSLYTIIRRDSTVKQMISSYTTPAQTSDLLKRLHGI
ncbi:MAG: hypothetical protein Q8L10_01560 [Candidatus Moranbacteria bacterium]|nr:hypothetical protein [Candidatus Moranbacteria bacterium]